MYLPKSFLQILLTVSLLTGIFMPAAAAENSAAASRAANPTAENTAAAQSAGDKPAVKPIFTPAEQRYIVCSGVLRVGLSGERPPFSQYDGETKRITGINADILHELESLTGLRFQLLPLTSGVRPIDLLQQGEYDMVCGITAENFAANPLTTSTIPFLHNAIVPMGKMSTEAKLDMREHITVTFPSSFHALQKLLQTRYPNLELKLYPTNQQCVEAVENGEADLFIQNSAIMAHYLQQPRYDDLRVIPQEIMMENLGIGMLRTQDPLLLSILNKGIRGLDPAMVVNSRIRHSTQPYRMTFRDFAYKFRIQLAVTAALIGICFILLLALFANRKHSAEILEQKNRELQEAVQKEKQASDAKSRFLMHMSHEVRTPMNAITGMVILAKNSLDDRAKLTDYLNKIDWSSQVLLHLINDVLDIAALAKESLQLNRDEFDVIDLLASLNDFYADQCRSKDLQFTVDTQGVTREFVIGDSLRLKQILVNLLSNAVKFTAVGSIRLTVTQKKLSPRRTSLKFTVTDTGCGMGQDMLNRLFRPFEQEKTGATFNFRGSGLGLAIAKRLTEKMQGTLTVVSQKDKGTTFTLELPLDLSEEEQPSGTAFLSTTPGKEAADPARSAQEKFDFTGKKALLAEDNVINLEIAKGLLRLVHMQMDTAPDGRGAVEKFQQSAPGTYDVILTDIRMPVMDGYEEAEAIRSSEHPQAKTIPIYAVTAYAFAADAQKALRAGMNGHIAKPIDAKVLYRTLKECFDRQEQAEVGTK